MLDIQHYKISSACECLGFYSNVDKGGLLWHVILHHQAFGS